MKREKKLFLTFAVSFMLLFYFIVMSYVASFSIHVYRYFNFLSGVIFEIIGAFILVAVAFYVLSAKNHRFGYLVSLVTATIIYTVVLDVLFLVCSVFLSNSIFILLNLLLLFIYCFVSLPMFIMGKK